MAGKTAYLLTNGNDDHESLEAAKEWMPGVEFTIEHVDGPRRQQFANGRFGRFGRFCESLEEVVQANAMNRTAMVNESAIPG